jgi:uncharacterized membrane protein
VNVEITAEEEESSMRFGAIWLGGATAAAAAQMLHAYSRLPEVMATHFDSAGNPDRWSPKAGYYWIIGIVLGMTVLWCVAAPLLLRWIPSEQWNVPRKEDWLRANSRQELIDVVGGYVLFFGGMTILLVAAINHLVFRVALGEAPGLGPEFFWLLGGYLASTAFWCAAFLRRLRSGPRLH